MVHFHFSLKSQFQFASAAGKGFSLKTHLVEHVDEEVTECGVVFFVVRQVAAVLQAATGQQDGVVTRIMSAGVAEVAAEKCECVVEQRATRFAFGFHLCEKIAKATHDGPFNFQQLLNTLGVATVMRKIMVFGVNSVDLWYAMIVLDNDTDYARGISLHDQWHKIE